MDKFKSMEVFIAVAEAGSYTCAADKLHITPQMIAKYISSLEERLGARLINRTTRRQSLTELGERYFVCCKDIISDVNNADLMALQASSEPQGSLRISAPQNFGCGMFMRFSQAFIQRYPKINLDLTLTDAYMSPAVDGFEAVLRLGEVRQNEDRSLISRTLKKHRLIPCAAPSYLEQNGIPAHPDDLLHHSCMSYVSSDRSPEDTWQFIQGEERFVARLGGQWKINDTRALVTAAVNGAGIVLAAEDSIADYIRNGQLYHILQSFEGPSWPLNLVYRQDHHQTAALKAFIEDLTSFFRNEKIMETNKMVTTE